jgi:precorrin-6A/cobalt-precorrin-6A reductase
MILVFGGTTEGKKVAGILEKKECPYFYSTKTEIELPYSRYGTYRFGAFSANSLIAFCSSNKITKIIHASHPFAEELHQTIHQGAEALNIPVLRYERLNPEKAKHDLLKYISSYELALNYLEEHNHKNVLALTGVQTIEKLKPYWKNNNMFFRILPRESSLKSAENVGFPIENLIQEMPGDNLEHELALIRKHHINCILTKESGESGFLHIKIEAALQSNIPMLILERPQLPSTFISVWNEDDLISQLNNS